MRTVRIVRPPTSSDSRGYDYFTSSGNHQRKGMTDAEKNVEMESNVHDGKELANIEVLPCQVVSAFMTQRNFAQGWFHDVKKGKTSGERSRD